MNLQIYRPNFNMELKMTMKLYRLLLLTLGVWGFAACTDDEAGSSITLECETELTIEAEATAKAYIDFTASREWEASTTASWLHISPTKGQGGSVKGRVIATALTTNDSIYTRTATVILTAGSVLREITILQAPDDYVHTEQTEYELKAEGEIFTINFTTNVPSGQLVAYGDGTATWLSSVSKEEETRASEEQSAYSLTLKAEENTAMLPRTTYVYFAKVHENSEGEEDDEYEVISQVLVKQEGTGIENPDAYKADGGVVKLQEATRGTGIPIVLMGDGYRTEEVENGTYHTVMTQAMENLFTEEPMISLRDYFDVYAVTAISQDNTIGKGYNTAFSCELEGYGSTGISGDEEAVIDYVLCVEGIDIANTQAVVILNTAKYAGTTYFGFAIEGKPVEFAVAYCPHIYHGRGDYFRQVLVHESVGHGFAKLDDEYSYEENGRIPDSEITAIRYRQQTLGWARNVDFTSDESQVLWSNFLTDTRYASEGLGVFEGACTYIQGAYRPTVESMMNGNTEGFNAPSRQAIYDMAMHLGEDYAPSYEEFVAFDLQTRESRTAAARTRADSPTMETASLPRPVFVGTEVKRSRTRAY